MRAPSWLGIAKLAEAKLADVRNAAMENCCVSSQTNFRLSPSRSSPPCSVACPAAVSAKEQLGGAKSPRLADSGSDGVVERTLGRQAGAS